MTKTNNYVDASFEDAGLRERKRIETLCLIEDCTTRLILEHGYDSVTVDDICAAAEISKRTFFNYFDSKRTATIGQLPIDPSEERKTEFSTSDPARLLHSIISLAISPSHRHNGKCSDFQATLLKRRKQIMQQSQELTHFRISAIMRHFDGIEKLVVSYLYDHPDARRAPHLTVEAEASALVIVAHSAIRMGTSRWLETASTDHTGLLNICFEALQLIPSLVNPEVALSEAATANAAPSTTAQATEHAAAESTAADATAAPDHSDNHHKERGTHHVR